MIKLSAIGRFNILVKKLFNIFAVLLSFLFVALLQDVLVVRADANYANFTCDTNCCLVIFDFLDEGLAARLSVPWLHLLQVLRCLCRVHLCDLSS